MKASALCGFPTLTRVSESLYAMTHTPPNKYAWPLCSSAPIFPQPHPLPSQCRQKKKEKKRNAHMATSEGGEKIETRWMEVGYSLLAGPIFHSPKAWLKRGAALAGPRQLILAWKRTFACSDTLGEEQKGRGSLLRSVWLAQKAPVEVFLD